MRYERADFEWTAISPQDGFQPANVRPSSTSEGGRRNRRSGANRLERGSLLVSRPLNDIQVQTVSRSRSGVTTEGSTRGFIRPARTD